MNASVPSKAKFKSLLPSLGAAGLTPWGLCRPLSEDAPAVTHLSERLTSLPGARRHVGQRFGGAFWGAKMAMASDFYLRYYVGHKGKFGHEFLEFEFRPDGERRSRGRRGHLARCWAWGSGRRERATGRGREVCGGD